MKYKIRLKKVNKLIVIDMAIMLFIGIISVINYELSDILVPLNIFLLFILMSLDIFRRDYIRLSKEEEKNDRKRQ